MIGWAGRNRRRRENEAYERRHKAWFESLTPLEKDDYLQSQRKINRSTRNSLLLLTGVAALIILFIIFTMR